jgi:enoyl-CoA hydratase/carnithine racemase
MPFVNLGLCPEAASSLLVPQMLGYHRAAEALLLGEPFMAEAALEVGLVNRVVPPTECQRRGAGAGAQAGGQADCSLVETKRLMKLGQAAQVLEQHGRGGRSFGRMLGEPLPVKPSPRSWRSASPTFPDDLISGQALAHVNRLTASVA